VRTTVLVLVLIPSASASASTSTSPPGSHSQVRERAHEIVEQPDQELSGAGGANRVPVADAADAATQQQHLLRADGPGLDAKRAWAAGIPMALWQTIPQRGIRRNARIGVRPSQTCPPARARETAA